jgi:predicted Zn-dependent peptidase
VSELYSVRPAPSAPRPYHFPDFELRVLPNGLALLVAPMHKLPIVTVMLVVDAGATTEPAGHDGVSSLTARALLEGTARLSAAELTDRLERIGASVSSDSDWDTAGAGVSVLRAHVEEAVALLSEIVLTPAFPVREVERLKSERLAEIMQSRAEPRGLADEVFAHAVYAADSRYARPDRGDAEAVASLGPAALASFHAARYRPAGSTLIMAGDITADDAASIAKRAFASWGGSAGERSPLSDRAARAARALHLVERPDAPQSEIRVGHVGLPRTHPDYFPVLLMNAILGGLFSSRINLNLRERHAYTYGAHSAFEWRRGAGPFAVSTAVQSDVTAAAAHEILHEIDVIRSVTVAENELELARNYLAGVFPIKYETTDAVARALAAMVVFSLPIDYFDDYRQRVLGVTTAEVRAAAEKHLHPDALQLVVVGDTAAIRAPLEALAFGPVIRYGRDGAPVTP